jgi:phytol kinase
LNGQHFKLSVDQINLLQGLPMTLPDTDYWMHISVLHSCFLILFFACGVLVQHYSVRVNYTRKIMHFALFFLPQFMLTFFAYESSLFTGIFNATLTMAVLGLFIEPIRSKIAIINTMFTSIDRPEDRPYTLLWLSTQFLASYLVLMPLIYYLNQHQLRELLYIPILINGLGDGLAEPVGIRFGRHHYTTKAIFSSRRYTRSFEGSLCVFIVSLLAILGYQHLFTTTQLIAALLLIPPIMTLTEAFSPHTWDSPFLYLVGGVSLISILQL